MTGNCKKHGVTEFTLADANGNSVCRKCVQEWVQGWMVQGTLVALQDYLKAQETLPFSMGCHMDKSACSLCSDLPHDQHLAPKFHKGPEAVEFFAVSFVMAPKCAACGQTMKVAPGSQYRCVNGRGPVPGVQQAGLHGHHADACGAYVQAVFGREQSPCHQVPQVRENLLQPERHQVPLLR